jgi:hypothetical protein
MLSAPDRSFVKIISKNGDYFTKKYPLTEIICEGAKMLAIERDAFVKIVRYA